jgi:hypothetical protein
LYSSIFLILGAALLTITALLWGNSTNKRVVDTSVVLPRILKRLAPPKSQLHIMSTLPSILNYFVPFRRPAWIRVQSPIGIQAVGRVHQGMIVWTSANPVQQRFVGTQLGIVATDQHSIDLHQLLWYSGLALAIMTTIAILAGWLMAGRVLRPLHTITTTARDISITNLHERLRMAGPGDELKELGDTFDNLLDRLEGSFRAQRQFVANAAHELRTPLATMRAAIDVAANKPDAVPDATSNLANRLREDLDQIDRLLESFLTLARAQRGAFVESTDVALDEIVAFSLEENRAAIGEKGIDLDAGQLARVDVSGSQVLLTRLVDNLIDNAIKHNAPGGWLHVRVERDGTMARLVVENGGVVLSEASVTEFGQPFRRAGADRTGTENGSGLGLSIVEAIVEAHAGDVELHAIPSGGLQVIVRLPVVAGASSVT